MKRVLPLVITWIATLLLFSFVMGVPGKASDEQDINKLIQTATTPEDHMKIANYYEKQAEEAEVSARAHASMAASYESRGKPLPGPAKHCSNLSKDYTKAAEEYKAMAKEHKKMAEESQKK
jgi:hypothetical protein